MSEHDIPSDPNWKPLGHPHSKLPTVLVQVPWQLWVPWTHSFISIEDGSIRIIEHKCVVQYYNNRYR